MGILGISYESISVGGKEFVCGERWDKSILLQYANWLFGLHCVYLVEIRWTWLNISGGCHSSQEFIQEKKIQANIALIILYHKS